MKRQRAKSTVKNQQVKISKFFHVATPRRDLMNNVVTEENTGKLLKSTKVDIPFGISILQNELCDAIAERSNLSGPSSGILKLKKFVHSEDINSDEETHGKIEIETSSSQLTAPVRTNHHSMLATVSTSSSNHDKCNLKLTPLEQQIVALKQEHPELLLVVECGYKYQMFGEDAAMAGTILNMVAYKKNNFLSCSFPLHRLYVHVKKLVAHGCKVGIVRQKETAALKAIGDSKHAPFTRKLDMIYTKATFISDDDCEGVVDTLNVNIPLCMVFLAEAYGKIDGTVAQMGILAFFTQDSTVVYDHYQDDCVRSGLESTLTHLQPSEIVLPDRGVSDQTLNLIRQFSAHKLSCGDCIRTEFTARVDWTCASELLLKVYCNDAEMMDKLKELPPVIVCCLAMAYKHLKEFKLEQLITAIKNVRPYEAFRNDVLQMDGNCVRNLNLVPLTNEAGPRLLGSVFHVINRTRTKFGARLLRSWLLRPLVKRASIESRLEAVEWLVTHCDDPEIAPFKKLLKTLPDLEKQLSAVLHTRSKPEEFFALCKSWEQIKIMCTQLQFHYQEISPSLVKLLLETAITSLATVHHYTEQLNETAVTSKEKTRLFHRTDDYPQVAVLMEKIDQTESQLHALKPSICKTIGLLAMNYVAVSGDEYLIEVKNSLIRAVPATWIKISATKQCCRFRSPEVQQLFGELCCLRELLKIAADEAWLRFQRQVANTSHTIFKKANTAIATVDCLIALAEVAKSENYTRPTFVEEAGVLDISEGRHAILGRFMQQTSSSAEYVANDTKLHSEGVRCMIITGPNMGGKSCLLLQVGIIVVLAQVGSFVPATQATLSIFKSIFIRMGLHDEIYAGRSTFFMEMMETSAILHSCTPRSLVIIDELGRGTGTHDGSAIAFATLKYLVEEVKCLTLFVTHYPAVVQLQKDIPTNVANYHMGYLLEDAVAGNEKDDGDGEELVFLYTLTLGTCPKSFGLNVARLAGLQSSITARAKLKSESFFSNAESQRCQVAELKQIFQINNC
ncbi:DNA mismatch repair protein Msh3-like isoform X2 [Daphnia carinata]|uniref:DNA mismatch repair protein Msh3-like isoform X2 n=1 Tax=Daphnia carinata TaxID=120202 RepID=UPI00257A2A24|nr:DNA mismatch repair protein Msh3-like isoform X2 [Daphnia carinata]